MDIKNLVREDLVIFSGVKTKREALSQLADILHAQGKVKGTYKEAVLQREADFPTGLETFPYGIAIPHTDSIHVNEPAVAISILEHKLPFIQMGSSDEEVQVEFIFMLALKKTEDQLELLQLFVELIQSEQVMEKLKNGKTEEEIIQIINDFSRRVNQ